MKTFPILKEEDRLKKLQVPAEGKLRMILDTDTYNEIDDQFAVLYAMLSPDRIDLKGIHAELFFNDRSTSPADGMERSYQEILKIMKLMGRSPEGFVFRGCENPLTDEETPGESEAVDHLIEEAMKDEEGPLYVVGIGSSTNIASAILKEPKIIEKIVVVWLGGNASYWPDNREFNLSQDPLAAKVLFDCGVPLIQIPGCGVTGFLITTIPELEACLGGVNDICDYLVKNVKEYTDDSFAWSKPIWDVGAIGYLIDPSRAVSTLCPAPLIAAPDSYGYDPRRHLMRTLVTLRRDPIFKDLFNKLRNAR